MAVFMEQVERGHEMLSFVWGIPRPTYLISSGTGLHIYYLFEKPIPMFRNIVEQLEKLKEVNMAGMDTRCVFSA